MSRRPNLILDTTAGEALYPQQVSGSGGHRKGSHAEGKGLASTRRALLLPSAGACMSQTVVPATSPLTGFEPAAPHPESTRNQPARHQEPGASRNAGFACFTLAATPESDRSRAWPRVSAQAPSRRRTSALSGVHRKQGVSHGRRLLPSGLHRCGSQVLHRTLRPGTTLYRRKQLRTIEGFRQH